MIEDLHVAGMLRNRRLARRIADASWAEIRRQLTYKTERAGARLIVADRWFASSKTCSGCGTAKAKLALSERTYAVWPAASSWTGTRTPPATWPRWRPTRQSCVSSPTEPMSDVRLPRWQSDRRGKSLAAQRHRREAVGR